MILDAAASVLRLFPAETAHRATIRLARTFGPVLPADRSVEPRLEKTLKKMTRSDSRQSVFPAAL